MTCEINEAAEDRLLREETTEMWRFNFSRVEELSVLDSFPSLLFQKLISVAIFAAVDKREQRDALQGPRTCRTLSFKLTVVMNKLVNRIFASTDRIDEYEYMIKYSRTCDT